VRFQYSVQRSSGFGGLRGHCLRCGGMELDVCWLVIELQVGVWSNQRSYVCWGCGREDGSGVQMPLCKLLPCYYLVIRLVVDADLLDSALGIVGNSAK
jgi:hypothetical protein